MTERRRFSRLNLIFDAEVEFQGQVYSGEIVNLSLKGVLLELKNFPAQKNEICEILISLSENITTKFESRLIHTEENHFGFKFESFDLDSISHLRKCLELNSDDPTIIEKELFFLATGNRE